MIRLVTCNCVIWFGKDVHSATRLNCKKTRSPKGLACYHGVSLSIICEWSSAIYHPPDGCRFCHDVEGTLVGDQLRRQHQSHMLRASLQQSTLFPALRFSFLCMGGGLSIRFVSLCTNGTWTLWTKHTCTPPQERKRRLLVLFSARQKATGVKLVRISVYLWISMHVCNGVCDKIAWPNDPTRHCDILFDVATQHGPRKYETQCFADDELHYWHLVLPNRCRDRSKAPVKRFTGGSVRMFLDHAVDFYFNLGAPFGIFGQEKKYPTGYRAINKIKSSS